MKIIRGRGVIGGVAKGEALVTSEPFGFFGGVNPATGIVIDKRHALYGQSMKGKVFVYPEGRGSTVGAAIILELARTGCAPAAIINISIETITAAGGLLAQKLYGRGIPMIDRPDRNPIEEIETGATVEVDGSSGKISIYN
ncbi:MAG: DUF126 domain-containing protein [Clostridiales Family XIII bacterium]|jgi:predicted aconitase with swiveling domain|nr:DUF126 domain-containing protein [Clostridiales Family XIII bacterium]